MNAPAIDSILRRQVPINERFVPISLLGKGGMGWVVKAQDLFLGKQEVVLKFLQPHLLETEKALLGLRNEVLIARKLIHPNIVRTHSFASDSTFGHFIVMEFVPSPTLRERIHLTDPENRSLESTLTLFSSLLSGIQHAHAHGVIHVDIKPENIFVLEDQQAKLGDFGLSQPFRGNDSTQKVVGTPLYMAPEQFMSGILGKETDIYALGIVMFEYLVGHPPFQSSTLYNLGKLHISEPLPDIEKWRPDVPAWLVKIIRRCVEKAPGDRFSSAEEILQLFEDAEYISPEGRNRTSISNEPLFALPVEPRRPFPWRKIFSAALVVAIVTPFILAHYSRHITWLHHELLTATLRVEGLLGRELSLTRKFFALRTTRESTLLQATEEMGGVNALLRIGMPPDQIDPKDGRSYLQILSMGPAMSLDFPMILSYGANPNIRDMRGRTPLHLIHGEHTSKYAELLLQYGADINAVDNEGSSPLLTAVKVNEFELVRVLLRKGANPLLKDKQGHSAFSYAMAQGSDRMKSLFAGVPNKSPTDNQLSPR